MPKFRRRSSVIEAGQYICDGARKTYPRGLCFCTYNKSAHVHTMHNNQDVALESGDWIVPESDGVHFYPIKPDVFSALYEPFLEAKVVNPNAGNTETWFLLYSPTVSDIMGNGKYVGRTTNKEQARKHWRECMSDPYNIGKVVYITDNKRDEVREAADWDGL